MGLGTTSWAYINHPFKNRYCLSIWYLVGLFSPVPSTLLRWPFYHHFPKRKGHNAQDAIYQIKKYFLNFFFFKHEPPNQFEPYKQSIVIWLNINPRGGRSLGETFVYVNNSWVGWGWNAMMMYNWRYVRLMPVSLMPAIWMFTYVCVVVLFVLVIYLISKKVGKKT